MVCVQHYTHDWSATFLPESTSVFELREDGALAVFVGTHLSLRSQLHDLVYLQGIAQGLTERQS